MIEYCKPVRKSRVSGNHYNKYINENSLKKCSIKGGGGLSKESYMRLGIWNGNYIQGEMSQINQS